MFEQTFVESRRGAMPVAVAASLAGQCLAVAACVLLPLIYTYELPVEDWVRTALVFIPPRPPRPPAPAPPPSAAKPRTPARFEAALAAPQTIPESVAIYDDATVTLSGSPAPDLGIAGLAGGVRDGVLGVALPQDLDVPPPLVVGGRVQAAKMIHRVDPVYPSEALEQGIEGVVRLEAIVNVAGSIRQVRVLAGDPLLAASALEAVRQWRYRPTLLNGIPVEVITQFEVRFKISEPPPVEEDGRGKRKRRR